MLCQTMLDDPGNKTGMDIEGVLFAWTFFPMGTKFKYHFPFLSSAGPQG